ncbi:glutathione S-transferase domain-containing protein [Moelleriella libera RCEF 2490]|uniref:Glutathione S-transferase domain-containing protein n=1 Tax=Moelleriella libera RCEF 2490 TaxID=1081109 RepID=A0A168B4I4_9HYPO|nr:glutathione S-transferase domain-containing protein [Moelleriella libera RCEF 2490]
MADPASVPGSSSAAGLPGVGQFRLHLHPHLPHHHHYHHHHDRPPLQPPQVDGGQFGILAPETLPLDAQQQQQPSQWNAPVARHGANADNPENITSAGKLPAKLVVNPPDLEAWREKLFNVDGVMVLTDEQFETYFPHVDNVYSHRSTQRYKRKPFISHYWDCRMKGRPPGTPKSKDPAKQTRKRSARERDLCHVKIRITEYLPGATVDIDRDALDAAAAAMLSSLGQQQQQQQQQRFWTIQRVNGNGVAGNNGVPGPHRHSLAKSDEIKKNSVQRYLAQRDREAKRAQRPPPLPRKYTGAAAATIKKHSAHQALKLYAACYCPFSQRVWMALELKGFPYQYVEVEPLKLTAGPDITGFAAASPRGTVPAIRHGGWTCTESAVILEYVRAGLTWYSLDVNSLRADDFPPNVAQLEDLDGSVPRLLPGDDAQHRATCRLWVNHINTLIVPAFYALLRANDANAQSHSTSDLQTHITSLVLAADSEGPLFAGPGGDLCLVDVHFAPFAVRLSRVLKPARGWTDPVPGTRWNRWLDALETNAHLKATMSADGLYTDTMDVLLQEQEQEQRQGQGQGQAR